MSPRRWRQAVTSVPATAGVSVYIIAFNEIDKIEAAIASVQWADDILVIDSHSTDGTTELAQKLGARVEHVEFQGYGRLRNAAIEHCSHEWIFSLDADERCTSEVANEIMELLASGSPAHDYYFVPRRNFFLGRWIRHSGWYPNFRQPQLFKKGMMIYDDLPVHEGYLSISKRPPGFLRNAIWQFPFKDVGELLRKADKYSTLGALKLKRQRVTIWTAFGHGVWSFVKHYIFKLGFLDGGPGLVIAVANFEGTFYRHLKAVPIPLSSSRLVPTRDRAPPEGPQ
jgi:glycosyltransferase involved in cell wall biosynthesis